MDSANFLVSYSAVMLHVLKWWSLIKFSRSRVLHSLIIFIPYSKPLNLVRVTMELHRIVFLVILVLFDLLKCAYPFDPNLHVSESSVFFPKISSNGVVVGWLSHGIRFVAYTAVFIAWFHQILSTCKWLSIPLTRSVSVRFMRSASIFGCGEDGTFVWCTIPNLRHISAKRLFTSFVPLSVLIHLSFLDM